MDLAIGVLFFSILMLSVFKEFESLSSKFPFFMQFIPSWSFFAPTPNMYDYHLLYREVNQKGNVLEWKSAFSIDKERPFYSIFWHPEKKFAKAFLDMVIDLMRFSEKVKDREQICLSFPYLQILNYLNAISESSEKIQFVILSNSRVQDYQVVFLSELHHTSKK